MTERLKMAWTERSPREKWMLGVMFALMAIVILWLAIWRPLNAADRASRDALREAIDRNAVIRAKTQLLKSLPRGASSSTLSVPLDQFVGQSAGEAGLTLDRAQAQGTGRLDMSIASVRPVALLSWLVALEGQGVQVETITARPAPTAGSLSVQAVLVRDGVQ